MIKQILILAGIFYLSSPIDSYAQQNNKTPFYTIGETQNRTLAVEEPTDTAAEEEMKEVTAMDMPLDSTTNDVPLLIAMPLKDIHVNSPFGMRRDPMNRKKSRMHNGLDLRAKYEDVYSMFPGVVTATGSSSSGGNYVTINYGIVTCSFLHLSKIDVESGQHVEAGQKIAVSGNTGKRTTGPHLHLSCKWSDSGNFFDPRILLKFITDELIKLKIQ